MNAENQPTMLGVYWYFGFPEGLYTYHYFKFFPGYGGHADNPAELNAVISVDDGVQLLNELQRAVELHPFSYLRVTVSGTLFHISTGGYQLFDFDFKLIEHVDQLLAHSKAEVISKPEFVNPVTHQFIGTKLLQHTYPRLQLLKVVGSEKKKFNAETVSVRLDCHILKLNLSDFISAISKLTNDLNITVAYYFSTDGGEISNLMFFFTNGRQGVKTIPITVNLLNLEQRIDEKMKQFKAQVGFHSDVDYPAHGKLNIIRMNDEDYILG